MATIKVKFRESLLEGREWSIYYQIIHDRVVRQWNPEYKILSEEWDQRRSDILLKPMSDRRSYLQSIRQRIKWDIDRFKKIVDELSCSKGIFSSDDIIDEFAICQQQQSFFNFMRSIILRLKEFGKQRTSETYSVALNSLRRFRNDRDIVFDEFDSDMMEAYEAFLTRQGLVPNSRSFHMRILRAVYNRAVEKQLTENKNPFRHVYTGVDKTAKRALDIKTLKRIKDLNLDMSPKIDFARDMFLLSFYFRGMSFIDMAYLKKTDLINGYVVYRRRKTGQQLSIKWSMHMQNILNKYPANETQYLLPIITSVTIATETQFRSKQFLINVGLKKVAELVGIKMALTLYCSRHSWASIAKSKGVPVGVISDGLGHDSELTTQIYLSTLDTSAVDKANAMIMKAL